MAYNEINAKGEDLRYDLTITLEDAVFGIEKVIKVPLMEICKVCNGNGCRNCQNSGKIRVEKDISINIPKGVDTGNRLRICEFNNSGDLYIYLNIKPHPIFQRVENDLYCEISISPAELGKKIEVPTIEGKVKLKIPNDIKSGEVLKIEGKGVPFLRSRERGDEFIKINILTP